MKEKKELKVEKLSNDIKINEHEKHNLVLFELKEENKLLSSIFGEGLWEVALFKKLPFARFHIFSRRFVEFPDAYTYFNRVTKILKDNPEKINGYQGFFETNFIEFIIDRWN